jgi:hypothetical protein
MRVLLADDIGGGILALLVLCGVALVSLLALGALFPAARGIKAVTLLMAAPAFIAGVSVTIWLGITYAQDNEHADLEFWSDVFMPWMLFAGPALGTALLAGLVLWLKRRKMKLEEL